MVAATAPAQARMGAKPADKGKAAPAVRAFRVGVQSHEEINYDITTTMGASTQDLAVLNIPPAGFLRGAFLLVESNASPNTNAATTFAANGPFNAIDTITLEDVNSAPIVGPLNGFDLYLINKYGGYAFVDDPRSSPIYLATTGSSAAGGAFAFALRIPVELVDRDALGALPNKSGTAMFKVRIRLAATATIYGVAPNSTLTVRVRIQQVDWWDPDPTDLKGRPLAQNPPAVQTTQYWSKAAYAVSAGDMRQQHERVGYLIRNLIGVLYDTSNSRTQGDADWPDPFTIQFEANILFTRLRTLWRHYIAKDYGYTGATPDTAASRDYGVYPIPFNMDFCHKPGWETRRGYLPTSSAARLEFQGTIGGSGAHTLVLLTNDVAPARDEAELTV